MAIHGDCDRDNGIRHDVAKLRPCSAVDRAGGQVKQQVDGARRLFATEQVSIELLQPRPNAGKGRDRSE